jgi:predicted RND superfamily exporter protein
MNSLKVSFSERVAVTIRRYPVLAVLAAFLLCVLISPGVKHLHSDFTHHGYFYETDPALQDLERMEQRFGNDDTVVVAVHSPSGIFDKDSAEVLAELTRKLWKVPDVVRVDSISNFRWVHSHDDELVVEPLIPDDVPLTPELLAQRRQVAINHESLPGYLISKDARSALVFARLRPALGHPSDAKLVVQAVQDAVNGVKRTDHAFYVTGGPAIEAAYAAAADKDTARMLPLVLAACVVILSLLLRNFAAVMLCMVVALAGSFGSVCMSGLLHVAFTSVTAALPIIFIAISITDPIRMLSAFLLERARGVDKMEAAQSAITKNFLPTVATSCTTAVGFLSYLTADIKTVAGFGLVAGFSCLVAWSFGQLFVGGMLYLLPWKKVARRRELSIGKFAVPLTAWIFKSRKYVIAGFAVLTIAAAALTTTIKVDADPVQYFAKGHPLREATEFIERGVGAARGVEIVVDSHVADGIKSPAFLAKVERLERWLRARPRITQTISTLDILKHTNRALHNDDKNEFRLPPDSRTVA